MSMDSAEQRLEDLRAGIYRIIDPITSQGKPPSTIQIVLLTVFNALLDMLECKFLDVVET